MKKRAKELLHDVDEKTLMVYFVLRFLVLVTLIIQALNRNWQDVFLCLLTLILFFIPFIIDKRFKIDLPTPLEIIILLFIFSAEILGEIQNFYGQFPYWDTLLHTLNGFLCAAIGFSLIDILNQSERLHISLSPVYVALVAFCFSMTIGVLWEFFEFGADQLLKLDMQKDRIVTDISSVKLNPEHKNIPIVINDIESTVIYYRDGKEIKKEVINGGYLDIGILDTMKDLIVNFIGAIIFSFLGYLYIRNRDKYKLAENFIPVIKKN